MPLYEYECDACGHRFEVIQKFSDALVDTCPKCGSKVRKLMSSPAIQFKGSGWYITDYAKKDGTPAAKAGGKEASSTGGGESSPASTADNTSSASSATPAKSSEPAKS